jgi:hypothetical protein
VRARASACGLRELGLVGRLTRKTYSRPVIVGLGGAKIDVSIFKGTKGSMPIGAGGLYLVRVAVEETSGMAVHRVALEAT